MRPIDLRSDTVTRPTQAMREAMARAEVGDDVYGEDPTVNRLEAQVAALLGKEAAVFVPTGTMGNQIALQCHTRRGDEVLLGQDAHLSFDESGAGAAWAGVQFREVGRGGRFSPEELEDAIHEPDVHCPRQSLVALENPHNRAGGLLFDHASVLACAAIARRHGLGLHLDGARLWNAAIASGRTEAELAAPFDTVNVCFSKGLGAPVGSALCGPRELVDRARHFRKMFGGGMRQAGVLAAGAIFALEHHRARLAEDHAAARVLEAALREVVADPPKAGGAPPTVAGRGAGGPAAGGAAIVIGAETNQVNVDTPGIPAERLVEAAMRRGVIVGAMSRYRTRAVAHLDVAPADVPIAARALADALREVLAGAGRRP